MAPWTRPPPSSRWITRPRTTRRGSAARPPRWPSPAAPACRSAPAWPSPATGRPTRSASSTRSGASSPTTASGPSSCAAPPRPVPSAPGASPGASAPSSAVLGARVSRAAVEAIHDPHTRRPRAAADRRRVAGRRLRRRADHGPPHPAGRGLHPHLRPGRGVGRRDRPSRPCPRRHLRRRRPGPAGRAARCWPACRGGSTAPSKAVTTSTGSPAGACVWSTSARASSGRSWRRRRPAEPAAAVDTDLPLASCRRALPR